MSEVRDLLSVEPTDGHVDDDELAAACREALAGLGSLPPDVVAVTSKAGRVVLTGEVRTGAERLEAYRAVASVNGVVDIVDDVRVTPEPQPEDVAGRIAAALARTALVPGAVIEVSCADRTVYLDGVVGSTAARGVVELAALGVPGVAEVVNRTDVVA